MAKLTAQSVENTKPGTKRKEIPDAGMPGLYLIIQPSPSGAKSWAYRYRFAKKTRKFTLGSFPKVSLAGAHKLAREAELEIRQGRDPARAKKEEAPSFGKYTDKFFDSPARRGKAGDAELRRTVQFDCGDWRDLPIADISRGKIKTKLDAALARSKTGSTTTARQLYTALRAIFQLAVEHEVLAENPVEKLSCPSRNNERDRVLSDDELIRIWTAAETIGYLFGAIIKLLILTGARRDEIADARVDWLDNEKGALAIPRSAMKTRAGPHVIYLSPLMRDVLAGCPRLWIAQESGFLFTTNGRSPFSGWSKAKHRLDALSGISDWRLHDLRRTAKTGWQKLKIPFEVRQMMSAHAVAGVQGVYERHDWAAECRAGFEAWSRYVHSLVDPSAAANVVQLRAAAGG